MLLAKEISNLITLDRFQLKNILDDSGYSDCLFDSVEFVGITNSGQFCYYVKFYDFSCEDDNEGEGKVFVRKTATGELVADF